MERTERQCELVARRRRRGAVVATLLALSLGACFGGPSDKRDDSEDDSGCRRDDDCVRGRVCLDIGGNRNEICDKGETCECGVLEPATGGGGGRGGDGAVGGGGTGTGASAGDPGEGGTGGDGMGCTADVDCPRSTVCIDNLRGDNDGFCESGEVCTCAGIGTGGGGTAGTGGSGGTVTGGTGGRGGGGTGGGIATALGEPCASSAECGGAPFVCLTPDGLADGSGMPNGLCTVACTVDDACLEFASEAYCVTFTDTESYCIQGCRGGQVGAPKCRVRTDFACGILDTLPTTVSCVSTDDCAVEQLCLDGVCQNMITACVPTCGGDFDCGTGQFCDFMSGFCVPTRPTGLPIGSLCDPTLPAAADPCNGFCQATDSTETEGTCAAFCSASLDAVGCGWNGQGMAEAGCLFATVISRDAAGGISLAESDLMLCGQLCDCNADCPATSDLCMDENAADPTASIQAIFGRGGYCRPLLTGETTADSLATCP